MIKSLLSSISVFLLFDLNPPIFCIDSRIPCVQQIDSHPLFWHESWSCLPKMLSKVDQFLNTFFCREASLTLTEFL